jgi:hypothetical protein
VLNSKQIQNEAIACEGSNSQNAINHASNKLVELVT